MSFTEGAPTFMDLIEAAFDEYFRKFTGPMLAEIKSYNQTNQTADLQPLVKIYVQDTLVDMPILRQVPIQWPGGGDGALTFPLASGDVCGIIPQGVDISNWVASGSKNQAAATRRKFSLSDVVAIPRFKSISSPLPVTAYSALGPVLSGGQIFLGNSTAVDFIIKGNTHNTLFSTYLYALQGAATTWLSQPPLDPGAITFLNALITITGTLAGSLATALSAKVKTV